MSDINILDWVVLKEEIANKFDINQKIQLTSGLYNYLEEDDYKKWKPEKEEWCWFYDGMGNIHLSQFVKISEDNDYFVSKTVMCVKNYCPCCEKTEPYLEINEWESCEPFIGNLSNYHKEN